MIVNKWQALETWYSFCSLDVLPLILYPLMILDRFLYCYVDAVFTKLLANGDFLYSHSKYTYYLAIYCKAEIPFLSCFSFIH